MKASCPVCLGEFMVKKDGTMRWHCGNEYQGRWRQMCRGVGKPPTFAADPVHGSAYTPPDLADHLRQETP